MATGSIEHVGIDVHDLDEIVGFLEQTFGLTVARAVTIPDRLRAAFIPWGDVTIELIERVGDARANPPARVDHLAVCVDDLNAEVERLHAAGITTETPEPTALGGRPTIFVDGAAHGIRLQFVGPPA
jgi:catechol 2,3-dioxygenase-like lactoylglutathione lyase family enzyme